MKHAKTARAAATRNLLDTFDITSIAGRDQLAGVFRYLRGKPNWMPRLISRAADFTPDIIRNAHSEKIDGIIINHAGSPETEDALAKSDIPLAVIGIRNPKLVARTKAIALIRNDNVETGRIAAHYFLSLGNFRDRLYALETLEEYVRAHTPEYFDESALRTLRERDLMILEIKCAKGMKRITPAERPSWKEERGKLLEKSAALGRIAGAGNRTVNRLFRISPRLLRAAITIYAPFTPI